MRIFLHIILPLFLPVILYAIWSKIDAKRKGEGFPNWEEGHWFWVIIVGFIFTAGSLIYISTLGSNIDTHYQSPKIQNGNILPGYYK
jgi:hypothetical protein